MSIQGVSINEDCTGCELCIDTCPEVFEMGDEFAQVRAGADLDANEDSIREAADDCPVEAIQIEA
jgi:ferredoxin